MVEVFDIIAAYGANCHCCADDMHVYASVPASMAGGGLHYPARPVDVEERA